MQIVSWKAYCMTQSRLISQLPDPRTSTFKSHLDNYISYLWQKGMLLDHDDDVGVARPFQH